MSQRRNPCHRPGGGMKMLPMFSARPLETEGLRSKISRA